MTSNLGHIQTGIATPSLNLGVVKGSIQRPDPVIKRRQTTSTDTIYGSLSPNKARKRATEREGGI